MLGVRRHALLVGLRRERRPPARARSARAAAGSTTSSSAPSRPRATASTCPCSATCATCPAVLDRERVDELIVTDSDFGDRELLEIVDHAHRRGRRGADRAEGDRAADPARRVRPGPGDPAVRAAAARVRRAWTGSSSAAFDLVVSALVLVVGLPLWLAIAAAVKLNSRGPVFYRDRRVGLGEREFGMLKFRTMRADAAGQQAELEASNEADGPLFKIREDPRVTRGRRASCGGSRSTRSRSSGTCCAAR